MSAVIAPRTDPGSEGFWEALRRHELVVQSCGECKALRFPPKPVCPRCTSSAWSWQQVSGRGRVLSWVVTHHVFNKAYAGRTPYTVLLIELEEQPGLLMYGNPRPEDAEVREFMPVQVEFEDFPEGFTLAQWRADEAR